MFGALSRPTALWRVLTLLLCFCNTSQCVAQNDVIQSSTKPLLNRSQQSDQQLHFPFDGKLDEWKADSPSTAIEPDTGKPVFVKGLEGQAIKIGELAGPIQLTIPQPTWRLDSANDFSVRFWVRTTISSDTKCVLLSTKKLADNSINSQRQKGWTFFISNGTWGWNMGSGNRRISYERTNGEFMPINDGRWHQLAMTYDSENGLVRLYFDGKNWVTYNVKDSSTFEFGNEGNLLIGWNGEDFTQPAHNLPVFVEGANRLQTMLDEFNGFGLPPVRSDEFQMLVSRPTSLFDSKIAQLKQQTDVASRALVEKANTFDLNKIETISKRLMRNPYTVHQSKYYNEVALLFQLYELREGKIKINQQVANRLAKRELLDQPRFELDDLNIWNRQLESDEILASYSKFFRPKGKRSKETVNTFVAGSWNIYHGGLHHSVAKEGWDSRQAIIDMIETEKIDILMMQETYSSGDHIAAELGFYLATTIDWDNMFQGSNISVLSRYPIEKVDVPPNSTFMSVGTKVSLGETQDIYVVSSWFGMRNFDDVFNYHQQRFAEADSTPVLFAGDFNAVPHTDGGTSPASRKLLESGFIDAYRSLYPDAKRFPGYTHRSNRRIDQLYYKGSGLKNTSTEIKSTWPSKFPSDHYLIKSVFELNTESGK